jgi:hypothetical protein
VGEPRTLAQRIGLTRVKGAVIGVLAVALVAVIYMQYGGSSGEEIRPVSAGARSAGQAPRVARGNRAEAIGLEEPAVPDAAPQLDRMFNPSHWESPELAQVVAYDPFALPASFPRSLTTGADSRLAGEGDPSASAASTEADELAAAIEQMRMELEALRQRGVQVIVHGRDKFVAMIGDRIVHVGDVIDGFTVTAIEPDGVRVERNVDQ